MAEDKSERRLRWEARRRRRRRRRLVRRLRVIGAVVLAAAVVAIVAVVLNREPSTPEDNAISPTTASESARAPYLLTLGDSFLEGTGATSPEQGIAQQVADGLGMKLNNLSTGGTGYLNPGPVELNRQPVSERLAEIRKYVGDVVLVATGLNDQGWIYESGNATIAEERAAIRYTLTQLAEEFPEARIVAVGPFWPNGFPVPGIVAINNAIKAEAERLELEFIDPIGDQWITGSVDGSRPGNAAELISADKTHPTQDGHDYFARRLLEELGAKSTATP